MRLYMCCKGAVFDFCKEVARKLQGGYIVVAGQWGE